MRFPFRLPGGKKVPPPSERRAGIGSHEAIDGTGRERGRGRGRRRGHEQEVGERQLEARWRTGCSRQFAEPLGRWRDPVWGRR